MRVARLARASASNARWIALAGWLCWRASLIWLRVSPPGWLVRAVDVFGERVAGRALQCPAGGAGGVVPQRERRAQVVGVDPALAVGECVEEGETDDVRFGAGADRAGDPGLVGVGELGVGVMPQLARVLVEAQPAGGASVLDRAGEHVHKAGAF